MGFPQVQTWFGTSRRPYMASSKLDWNGIAHCGPISNRSAMLNPDMILVCMHATQKTSQSSMLTTCCCFAPKKQLACAKLELAGRYEMHDLGEAHWFLTMEITCDRVAQMITIDQ